MKTLQRCTWAETDPLLREYHDAEWGKPIHDSRALWEMLMLEGFQAGLSWLIVLRKREVLRKAFHNFDPHMVARFTDHDVARLMADPGIIRARAKIIATINAARIYLAMQERGEDFSTYAWNLAGGTPIKSKAATIPAQTELSQTISADLKRRGFKFVGPVITYAWMQAVGIVNDHAADCFRRNQV